MRTRRARLPRQDTFPSGALESGDRPDVGSFYHVEFEGRRPRRVHVHVGLVHTMNERSRAHVLVEGRVQGVGFRYCAHRQASALGLGGWVCNREDGHVEVLFEGKADAVEAMIRWCKKGPAGAHVNRLSVDRSAFAGEFADFSIRR